MAARRIDAHHHLWHYRPADYPWIGPDMPALARDFLVEDLATEVAASGLDGTIAVQARQSLEETRFLLSTARNSQIIHGVVGWAPLGSRDFPYHLEALRDEQKLLGLRHVVQDEPDDDFLHRVDFNEGIRAISAAGLTYDILIYERHLPAAISFVDRHPQQLFILDHAAKPRVRERVLDPWRSNIRELAQRENVYCKVSGLVTEADWRYWTRTDLEPYFDALLDAFGPRRLMAGSDWPVCLLATSYERWFSTLRELIQKLSEHEQDAILGGTAAEVYQPRLAGRYPQ